MRREASGKILTPHIKNVGVESNLYMSEIDGVADDYIEKELSKLEGSLPPLLDMIADGTVPPAGSRERQGLSLLMAIQRARTPEAMQWMTFPRRFVEFCGESSADLNQMRVFLSTKHLGFEPAEREVKAALDWVIGLLNTHPAIADLKNHEIVLHTLRATVEHVVPLLQQMRWNIGTCRKSCFLTSDRPLALWCATEPVGKGVGVETADEIWFPVDPRHVLILRKQGWDSVEPIKPARAYRMSAHLARHAHSFVVGATEQRHQVERVTLATSRPTLRFWAGSGTEILPDGTHKPMGDVIHTAMQYVENQAGWSN